MSSSKCPSDHTLLQIGTLIHYQEQSFEVVGRAQFLHSAGFWNEWHLLDQQKESWWLGEAMGKHFLFQEKPELPTPSRTTLKLGESTLVGQEDCTLLSVTPMKVAKTEGELPFHPPVGFKYLCYDLRSKGKLGFFLKYKDLRNEINTLYQGQWLPFDELHLENTNQSYTDPLSPPQFKCQQCHTPIQLYLGSASHTYYCPGCGTPYDTSSLEPKPLSQIPKAQKVNTPIEFGDRCIYQGDPWRCVAIFHKESLIEEALIEVKPTTDEESDKESQEKEEEKPTFFEEYLFFHPQKGYRTLLSLQDRWIWLEPTPSLPEPYPMQFDTGDLKVAQTKISHPSRPGQFRYFSSEKITTKNVIGEMPLGNSIGQTTRAHHFINPPQMLSLKQDLEQLSWSIGTHLSYQELQEQFPDRNFPQPSESTPPSPCQPNPHLESDKKFFYLLLCFFICFFLISFYQIFSAEKIHDFSHSIPPLQAPQNQTQEFSFPLQGSMDLRFTVPGIPYESYCSIKAVLTHQETQTSYQIEPFFEQESPQNEFYLRGMPKGRYTLTWSTLYNSYDPEAFLKKKASSKAPKLTVEISRSSFTHFAFLLSLILALPFAFGLFNQSYRFELSRHKNRAFQDFYSNLIVFLNIVLILINGASSYFFCSNNFLVFPTFLLFFFVSLALTYYFESTSTSFKANFQTIPLFLIVLILFASNSFFGYGYSSTHTKTNAIDITDPMSPKTFFYKPETYAPGGGRASLKNPYPEDS